jgi:twitching motility protein PilT
VSRPGGGLVVIVGERGAGVSATLYDLVDWISETFRIHIMTFEDPIESDLFHKLSMVSQREQDRDFECLPEALLQSSKHGASVVMINRLRTPEDMIAACLAGNKGQIVLAGLEARSVSDAVRAFEETMGANRWLTFCSGLAAIYSERLVPALRHGSHPVVEIFRTVKEGRALLEKRDWSGLTSFMERDYEYGMQTFEQGLVKAIQEGSVARKVALREAQDVARLQSLLDDCG